MCPRRQELGPMAKLPAGPDEFIVRKLDGNVGMINYAEPACTWCGSLSGDRFMQMIKDGYTIGPTDKNYKAYVQTGDGFHGKFYYQHLSEEQRAEFIELLNNRTAKLGFPGYFYVLPYFCKAVP
jgi:hypothetical protein